jgi:hypothetical protein
MWNTRELQLACMAREKELRDMYEPYVQSFLDVLVTKARTFWHTYYHHLMHACKTARTKKDRYIYFHYFCPKERICVRSSVHSVTIDELLRYTHFLSRLETFFGPHFKVRVFPISTPNYSYAITLHYYP